MVDNLIQFNGVRDLKVNKMNFIENSNLTLLKYQLSYKNGEEIVEIGSDKFTFINSNISFNKINLENFTEIPVSFTKIVSNNLLI